jgi:hypothetical protein
MARRQRRAETARSWDTSTAPGWTARYLGNPQLLADLAVWQAAESVPDTDLRPPAPPDGGSR